jgi:hypothetical protein
VAAAARLPLPPLYCAYHSLWRRHLLGIEIVRYRLDRRSRPRRQVVQHPRLSSLSPPQGKARFSSQPLDLAANFPSVADRHRFVHAILRIMKTVLTTPTTLPCSKLHDCARQLRGGLVYCRIGQPSFFIAEIDQRAMEPLDPTNLLSSTTGRRRWPGSSKV